MSEPEISKRCGCGKVYDRASFLKLADPAGGNFLRDEDGEQLGLLFKQCGCNSTLAVKVLKNNEIAA